MARSAGARAALLMAMATLQAASAMRDSLVADAVQAEAQVPKATLKKRAEWDGGHLIVDSAYFLLQCTRSGGTTTDGVAYVEMLDADGVDTEVVRIRVRDSPAADLTVDQPLKRSYEAGATVTCITKDGPSHRRNRLYMEVFGKPDSESTSE